MAKHLEKCPRKPILISVPVFNSTENASEPSVIMGSEEIITDLESMSGFSGLSNTSYISPHSVNTSSSSSQESSQIVLKSFFDSMSTAETEKLNSALAKAIFSSNLPLSVLENSYWQQFFKQIRPSYKVPSRHDLTNKLLDKEFDEINNFVKEQIKNADFVTIITDGWSNIRNEGIISYIVTTPLPIYYKSVESKDNRHTAEYISNELLGVINEIGAHKVTAIVTDNASNMKAAWKLVQEQYTHIFTVGCAAHGLNLLLSDIYKIKTFQMIITNAKAVVKYVKSKQALLSVFSSKQKLKKGSAASTLKLPSETRWCSSLIMFESLLSGKESLQETVIIEELNVDKDIRQLVLDNDLFWLCINSLVKVLNPICNGINKIESDAATLSDVPYVFLCIKKSLECLVTTPLQIEEEEEVKRLVEKWRVMFCQPIHYAAFLLDPRYVENDLDVNDYHSAVGFIEKFPIDKPSANILADFAQYKSHDSVYFNNSVWESAKLIMPLVWWKGFFKG